MIHSNDIYSEQLKKREQQLRVKCEEVEDLSKQLEGIQKAKSDMFAELLLVKESFTV